MAAGTAGVGFTARPAGGGAADSAAASGWSERGRDGERCGFFLVDGDGQINLRGQGFQGDVEHS
jgi:hypothetical protein